MQTIVDKCAVLAACAALLVVVQRVDAATVCALLVGIAIASASELADRRGLLGRPATEAAWCLVIAACSAWPAAVVALPLFAYDFARMREPRAVPVCALPLAVYAHGATVPAVAAFLAGAFCLLSFALGVRTASLLAARRQLVATMDNLQDKMIALEKSNRELAEASEYRAQAALLEERTRIARDIHDNVGHELTRLVLQTEALKAVHADDAQLTAQLDPLVNGLRGALDSMRRSVHALADASEDVPVALNRLAQESGIADVRVNCALDNPVPPEVARCMVAFTREALTNALRHAHAAHATVKVAEFPAFWQLSVENDGVLPPRPDSYGEDAAASSPASATYVLERRGMGLRSLEERVAALGGVFHVSVSDRFTVFASIPKGK